MADYLHLPCPKTGRCYFTFQMGMTNANAMSGFMFELVVADGKTSLNDDIGINDDDGVLRYPRSD